LKNTFVITIDGPSSSGKSTIAKLVAAHYKYTYIDSGSIYRAITFLANENKLLNSKEINVNFLINLLENNSISFFNNSKNQNIITLNDVDIEDEIRTSIISNHVSRVAQIDRIRNYVFEIQKKISKDKSIVMDGRDIGSVVFPDADVKFYIDASLKVRAKRRWNDLIVYEKNISLNDVTNDLFNRDKIDVNRKISPLVVPQDSIKINTDNFTIDQVVHKMIKLIDKKIKK
jgi:cytidylate kinase